VADYVLLHGHNLLVIANSFKGRDGTPSCPPPLASLKPAPVQNLERLLSYLEHSRTHHD
jgi:hypothetical protein